MEINTIQLKQNEHIIYVFVAEVKFIHDYFNVSIRENNREKGYQRNFSQRRFNSLKSYLVKGGFLPNSILSSGEIKETLLWSSETAARIIP